MKLTALGLASLFLLTGCTSSSSIDEQTKLVEYQACLTRQESLMQELRQMAFKNQKDFGLAITTYSELLKPDPKTGLINGLEKMKKDCAKYRP